MALCDLGAHTDWVKLGLPPHMNVRIGLHAGPAIRMIDPVTGQLNFMGSNVSRAARIEPVTPPGQVYCSEPFAALAEAEIGEDHRVRVRRHDGDGEEIRQLPHLSRARAAEVALSVRGQGDSSPITYHPSPYCKGENAAGITILFSCATRW